MRTKNSVFVTDDPSLLELLVSHSASSPKLVQHDACAVHNAFASSNRQALTWAETSSETSGSPAADA